MTLEELQNIKIELKNSMYKFNHNVKKLTDIIDELEKDMTTYKSKPHTIEAFQFTVENMKKETLPKWFENAIKVNKAQITINSCLLYTSPSPRDQRGSRMPSSA